MRGVESEQSQGEALFAICGCCLMLCGAVALVLAVIAKLVLR